MSEMDQFKETYFTECYELLEDMEERLMGLEDGGADIDQLNAIFRCAHSIKGGGGAFGFKELVSFTHILEALLDAMREGDVEPTTDAIDALLRSVDIVTSMVTSARDGAEISAGFGDDLKAELEELAGGNIAFDGDKIEDISQDNNVADEIEFFEVKFTPNKTIFASGNEPLLIIRELFRVGEVTTHINIDNIPDIKNLDFDSCYLSWNFEVSTSKGLCEVKEVFEFVEGDCGLEIEEFGAINLSGISNEESPPLAISKEGESKEAASSSKKDEVASKGAPAVTSIRVDLDKIDNLVNMVGEIVITQAMITMQTSDLPKDEFPKLIQGVEALSQHTRELQESVMAVRMQPVKSVFSRMPRIVRDLSAKLGKNIKIEMSGEATEIDKTVIEQLSDPLTHMIRNSVDHGIELPDIRKAAGKDEQGTIFLSADHSGGRIIIEIADDGGGINRERVFEKAVEKGVVLVDSNLTDEEVDNLIFHPGFSTADEVTDVSGRGVGMDVVRRNIESLGGTIGILNEPGDGTKLTISLPLTLAIMDGMIVRVADEDYIIPINNIIECLRPAEDDVKKVADGGDVINVRGRFVPIIYLYNIFNINDAIRDPSKALVVLVESGCNHIGIVVDELVGQQQVVIKNIEENTEPVEGIGGATILGDGNVALILDVTRLQRMVGVTNHNNGEIKQLKIA
jgi:two-component system chemotaxis sensor kinase CheA